jgi:hypothetical protein
MKIRFAPCARQTMFFFAPLLMLGYVAGTGHNPQAYDAYNDEHQAVWKTVPQTPDATAKYLFYLHGRIIEEKGIRPTDPIYGVYEYEQILDTFKQFGFTVISEARPKNTDVKRYASRIANQVQELLKAGVPPRQITVVGASKGAVIAMVASTLLHNRDVNFVIMSNCNDWVGRNFHIDLYGNVLSIYDMNDEFGRTCKKFFTSATGLTKYKEIELKIGTGHAILYKPMKQWVELIVEWAGGT